MSEDRYPIQSSLDVQGVNSKPFEARPERRTFADIYAEKMTEDLRAEIKEVCKFETDETLKRFTVRDVRFVNMKVIGTPYENDKPLMCRTEGTRVQKITITPAEENE